MMTVMAHIRGREGGYGVRADRWCEPVAMRMLASAAAPGLVRTFLDQALRKWGMEHLGCTVGLVASELVTNAASAAPLQEIAVTFTPNNGSPILTVWDPSDEIPRLKNDPLDLDDGDFDGNGGRGLHLVTALTAECGYHRTQPGGKIVFARFHPADI
jgi:anti-sigma regulatory factor (Ser/Thr protein kinase)